jgi:PBSX family phage portal protein
VPPAAPVEERGFDVEGNAAEARAAIMARFGKLGERVRSLSHTVGGGFAVVLYRKGLAVDEKDTEASVERRVATAKAHFFGAADRAPPAMSNAMTGVDDADRLFNLSGAIEPPYPPQTLVSLFEHSNSLRQNVDAYATNIDGFGHRFEPVIDFDDPDADERVAQSIYEERRERLASPATPPTSASALFPTPEEVAERKRELATLMREERVRLDRFFEFACEDMSFSTLRRRLRTDYEILGNAYMEVLRNSAGEVSEFSYLPAFTMRLTRQDALPTGVNVRRKVSEIDYRTVPRRRYFRRLVQVFEGRTVFFKELGDPRVISAKTGAAFESLDKMRAKEPDAHPATEVIHFRVHTSRSAYGIPRWIGNLLSVLGSRQAEEINHAYFENKSVPPLAVLVSGGKLSPDSVGRLEKFFETNIKGSHNFHKVLIIEAEGEGNSATLDGSGASGMRIELKPLTDAQQKDALFLEYDERNMDKVAMSFRLPRLLRGDIRDFNRATAEAALDFAEQQVFAPEREEFDFILNRKLLGDLGVRFWRFQSNAPSVQDPQALAGIIKDLTLAGILTPEEARQLTQGVFNKELARLDAAWTRQPLSLTLAGLASEEEGGEQLYTGDDEPLGARRASSFQVTRTAMGAVVTVNEARASYGMGPKLLPDGTPDPDGELTLAEFSSRVRSGAAPTAPAEKGTGVNVDLDAFVRDGGASLALGGGVRAKRRGTDPVRVADTVLRMRDALRDAEARAATREFLLAKADSYRDSGEPVPPALLARLRALGDA